MPKFNAPADLSRGLSGSYVLRNMTGAAVSFGTENITALYYHKTWQTWIGFGGAVVPPRVNYSPDFWGNMIGDVLTNPQPLTAPGTFDYVSAVLANPEMAPTSNANALIVGGGASTAGVALIRQSLNNGVTWSSPGPLLSTGSESVRAIVSDVFSVGFVVAVNNKIYQGSSVSTLTLRVSMGGNPINTVAVQRGVRAVVANGNAAYQVSSNGTSWSAITPTGVSGNFTRIVWSAEKQTYYGLTDTNALYTSTNPTVTSGWVARTDWAAYFTNTAPTNVIVHIDTFNDALVYVDAKNNIGYTTDFREYTRMASLRNRGVPYTTAVFGITSASATEYRGHGPTSFSRQFAIAANLLGAPSSEPTVFVSNRG